MTTEAEALGAASRWAARYALLPGTFARLVTSVTVAQERYARAVHHVERRAIAVRALPAYQSKARDVRAFAVPRDPWSVDPNTIESESRCVTTCPSCDGDKRVRCGTCAGRAELRCGQCAGTGRVMGQRGTKNCPGCRGRGVRKCSECRAGLVGCVTCDRLGRVEAWLTVERSARLEVCVHGSATAIAVHERVRDAADFDARATWPAQLEVDHELPVEQIDVALLPELDALADRVLRSRVQAFESRVARVTFQTALGAGVVELAGAPFVVARADAAPLVRRWALAATLMLAGSLVAVASFAMYEAQHRWFAAHGSGGMLFLTAMAAAFAAAVAGLGLALGRRGWNVLGTGLPIAAALVLGLSSVAVARLARPSAEHALALLASDPRLASIEAEAALLELPADPRAQEVLDQLHLDGLRARDLPAAVSALEAPWYHAQHREEAVALVSARLREAVEGAFDRERADQLTWLRPQISTYTPDATARVDAYLTRLQARDCTRRGDWACLTRLRPALPPDEQASLASQAGTQLGARVQSLLLDDRALPTAERARRLREATDLLEQMDELELTHPEHDPAAIASHAAHLEQEAAREAERAQREAERARERAEREAAQERARQEREAARARATTPRRSSGCAVRCCDGTCSPGCSSVHSGCCSRHGGVCGG